MVAMGTRGWNIDLRLFYAFVVYGWPSTGYSGTLFPAHSHFSQAECLRRLLWESLAAHVRLLSFVYINVSIMLGSRICLVLASRSIARGGSVA